MIILDDQEPSSSKAAVLTAQPDTWQPPQPTLSDLEAQPPFEAQPPPYRETDPILSYPAAKDYQRRASQRFFTAIVIAVIFLGAVTRICFSFTSHRKEVSRIVEFQNERSIRCLGSGDWAVDAIQSNSFANSVVHYASASFELPVSTHSIFLLTQGPTLDGAVGLEGSESDSDHVTVHVTAYYTSQKSRDLSHVCLLEREEGNYGVGILTNNETTRMATDEVVFVLRVSFPPHLLSPTRYKSLETNLPGFWHSGGDLQDIVHFENVTLRSRSASMIIKSLSADHIDIFTTNTLITGLFRASTYLSLETSNAYIETVVYLHSKDNHTVSHLRMKTEASPISANVRLSSGDDALGYGGIFKLDTAASRDHLNLRVLEAPLSSVIQVDTGALSRTAVITLPSSYEGWWSMQSSSPAIIGTPVATDPFGLGRGRRYEYEDGEELGLPFSRGRVWWGDKPSAASGAAYVNVRASDMVYVHLG